MNITAICRCSMCKTQGREKEAFTLKDTICTTNECKLAVYSCARIEN